MIGVKDDVDWPARTKRLTLRPATVDDESAIWSIRRDESVSEWITRAATDREDHRRVFCDPERLLCTVVIERDGHIIGDLMLALQDAWGQAEVTEQTRKVQAELGWTLARKHQGHGYALEAVSELIRICFEDLGLRRVLANCFADNEASWRLMERLGMRRENHAVRESLHRTRGWIDGYTYALLADEWPAARQR